ncbi:2-deoxyribose-5-phosphate aldolase, partial [Planctomycetota bacterium]
MKNLREVSARELAGYIDHTLLKPEATVEAVEQLCTEVIKYGFATGCVNPCYVRRAAELLAGHPSGVCGVVGFPLGAGHT